MPEYDSSIEYRDVEGFPGVHPYTIGEITRRVNWKHID